MPASTLKICIVDNLGGCYLSVARLLSPYFIHTFYHSCNQNPFPDLALSSIGTGFNEIEVLDDFWGNLDLFDIVIFPDIGFEGWTKPLNKLGKLTFGGSPAGLLEQDRVLFHDILDRFNMPTANTKYIKGLKQLKQYIKNKQDLYIKISKWRGTIETFHYQDKAHSWNLLEEMSWRLGPLSEDIEFVIESPVEAIAETGSDGYMLGSNTPQQPLWGVEAKNAGYVGSTSNCPNIIKEVNQKFSPALKAYQAKGFYSTEIRYTDKGEPYYTDPCMRAGSPPSNTYLNLISNWDKIIPALCKGEWVEPTYKAKYGCEIILKSNYLNNNYLTVSFPEEYKDNICLKGAFIRDGAINIIPFKRLTGFELVEFGSVVVIGDDYNKILQQAVEIAEKVEGYDITFEKTALDDALASIKNIEEVFNVKF